MAKPGGAATGERVGGPDVSTMAGLLKYRDQIRKEVNALRRSNAGGAAAFSLNPATLKPVVAKVGEAPARRVSPEETAAFNRDVVELRATLAKSRRTPQQRAPDGVPETASQEVGWLSAQYYDAISKPLRMATHKVSGEVEFAQAYAIAYKAGPFDLTQPIARSTSRDPGKGAKK